MLAPAVGQRQDGKGSGGQKVFVGDAVMRLIVRDRGDDPGLRIAPTHDADAGRRAQRRFAPVAGDRQSSAKTSAVGQRGLGVIGMALQRHQFRRGHELNARRVGDDRVERATDEPVLDDVAQWRRLAAMTDT
jgi:hypothetical protein